MVSVCLGLIFELEDHKAPLSIFGPLLFLTYVNNLPNGLKSKCKLFVDDTSLFSIAHDVNTSASDINNDLS